MCLLKLLGSPVLNSQIVQQQGFSPVCSRTWITQAERLENSFLQNLQTVPANEEVLALCFCWCVARLSLSENVALQTLQAKSALLSGLHLCSNSLV